jgi:hypothetical protein
MPVISRLPSGEKASAQTWEPTTGIWRISLLVSPSSRMMVPSVSIFSRPALG